MKRRPIRLRTAISLHFATLMVLWSALLIASLAFLLTTEAGKQVRDRGVLLTRALARECVPLIHREDMHELDNVAQAYMKSVPDARYVLILDAVKNPLYSTFPRGVPVDLLSLAHKEIAGDDLLFELVRSEDELLYDFQSDRAGVQVRLGLSLTPSRQSVMMILVYVCLVEVLGLLAVFALAFQLSKPLEGLSAAVQQALDLDHATGGDFSGEVRETMEIAGRFRELLKRLEDRTRQLDASKKLAYLGQIAAQIAHEINNPLGVIVLNGDFLSQRMQGGKLDPDASKEVTRLNHAARHAALVVQRFLQFARSTTREGAPQYRRVQLPKLVDETLLLLQDRIKASRCTIRRDVSADLPEVECDDSGIQQVLLNLVGNALDASPEGGEIVIALDRCGENAVIRIRDHGPGMSPDVLERASEPFFTTKERGTGLGLAVCRSILEAHAGRLLLDSEPGQGTTASAVLPIRRSP
ncbi:MAG: hypothetical protein HYY16_18000 [Planctomycetes bacterium]|nr:hypothetical protein [Planctomycetota bacterium]